MREFENIRVVERSQNFDYLGQESIDEISKETSPEIGEVRPYTIDRP